MICSTLCLEGECFSYFKVTSLANAHSCVNELGGGATSRLSDRERRQGHSFGDYSTTATFQQSKSVPSVSGTYLQAETVHCLCFALIGYQKNAFADELLRNSWGLGQFPCVSHLCCHCQSTPSFPANPFHPPSTWAYITRRIKLSRPSLNKCPFQKYNIKQT